MADKKKHAARSQRSHRDNKNFRQFAMNAYRTAEERAKVKFGHMLAEQLSKNDEKKENE